MLSLRVGESLMPGMSSGTNLIVMSLRSLFTIRKGMFFEEPSSGKLMVKLAEMSDKLRSEVSFMIEGKISVRKQQLESITVQPNIMLLYASRQSGVTSPGVVGGSGDP